MIYSKKIKYVLHERNTSFKYRIYRSMITIFLFLYTDLFVLFFLNIEHFYNITILQKCLNLKSEASAIYLRSYKMSNDIFIYFKNE